MTRGAQGPQGPVTDRGGHKELGVSLSRNRGTRGQGALEVV